MRMFGFRAFGGPEVMGLLDVPDPAPAAGQLLVRMRAAGLNPADYKVREGRRPAVAVEFPMAMGREAAGTVIAVGEGVSGFTAGDEVFGQAAAGSGALAELVLLDARMSARRPEGVAPEQAAVVPVSLGTALDILDASGLTRGQCLLVLGAGGGVGHPLCQLAVSRGLAVVGVASASKRDLVEATGARFAASGPGWPERVRDACPGGVDAVADAVGRGVLAEGAALAPGRPLISVADAAAAAELGGGGVERRRTSSVFAGVAALIADGRLSPHITTVLPLERAGSGYATIEAGHATGKIVVKPDA